MRATLFLFVLAAVVAASFAGGIVWGT